jgi:hypothetical protein
LQTRLRLEAVARAGFDARLVRLGEGRLTRSDGITYLETGRPLADATHHLALAGVRGVPCAEVPVPQAGHRAAVALDLAPLDDTTPAIDVVEVRCVSLGEAVAALSRRRVPFLPVAPAARSLCRGLLRDEDMVMAWRRFIWCSLASMRHVRSRVPLRPIVFDRSALQRRALRWTYVSAGALERWAFA